MDIKQYFKIDRCPNLPEKWYVDWSALGELETDVLKFKLCDIVFTKIKPWQLGIGYNVEYYRPKNPGMLWSHTTPHNPTDPIPKEAFALVQEIRWEVQWISIDAWAMRTDNNQEYFIRKIFERGRTPNEVATGIILETLDQAEQFVDLMEAQFTFYRLKQDYA